MIHRRVPVLLRARRSSCRPFECDDGTKERGKERREGFFARFSVVVERTDAEWPFPKRKVEMMIPKLLLLHRELERWVFFSPWVFFDPRFCFTFRS